MENFWTDEPDDTVNQQVEQLVLDPRFRSWVLQPTPESEAYWIDYLSLGLPDREEALRQARLVVLALQMPDYPVAEGAAEASTNQLLGRIRSGSGQPDSDTPNARRPGARMPRIVRFWGGASWRWVAAALFLLSAGWWAFSQYVPGVSKPIATRQTMPALPFTELAGTVVEESTTDTPRRVELPDGSSVALQPNSQLRYDKAFKHDTRIVTLSGQAFFDVTPNPKRPFLVYTEDVVTRVLGTSFTVTTLPGQPAIVSVRTGQVAVYTRQAFAQASNRPKDALLLTPNQQATFDKAAGKLFKNLVALPLPIPARLPNTLNFENRPVTEVIAELEQIYGIRIAYDHEQLSQCRVTVQLENEPLFDQLSLLCKLIDGQYQIADTTVALTASGCQ